MVIVFLVFMLNMYQKIPGEQDGVLNQAQRNDILGIYYICEYSNTCLKNYQSFRVETIYYLYICVFDLHIFDIFSAFIVLYIKRKDDVLEGYSRLQYLIKVSMF